MNDKASSGAILYNSENHKVLVIMYLMIFVHRAVLKIKQTFGDAISYTHRAENIFVLISGPRIKGSDIFELCAYLLHGAETFLGN
jgi:hypothetical protein